LGESVTRLVTLANGDWLLGKNGFFSPYQAMVPCPTQDLPGRTVQGELLPRKPEAVSPIGHLLEPLAS
jgi:hypothetical protein